jgi:alkylation response protein AidB-like acyl-CoA dehydrogenase
MGRSLPAPFVPSAVWQRPVLAAGARAQQKRLLPALAAGERVATLALVEETGSFDRDGVTLECAVPGPPYRPPSSSSGRSTSPTISSCRAGRRDLA